MSLLNFPFDRYSKELSLHYKKHSQILKARDSTLNALNNSLGTTLNITEYKQKFSESWIFYKEELKQYKKTKKELSKENSFLGRTSFKFWIFQFGLILLGFYFSIKSLIEDYKKRIKTGHEIISSIGVFVCLFWFYHLFFKTANDFYTQTYIYYEICICIATCVLVSKLTKYFATKENVIRTLLDLVFRIKTKHFRKMALKALYAEENDKSVTSLETVKQQSDDFDKDIKTTVKRVLN